MQLGKHENTRLTRGQKFFTMILALVEIYMTAYSSEPDRSPKSLMPKPLLYFQNTRYRKLQASKKDSPPIIVWHAISQHSQVNHTPAFSLATLQFLAILFAFCYWMFLPYK